MSFNTIEETIEAFQNGEMVIIVDDENMENGGNLVMAAEKVTPKSIIFMAQNGGGLMCLPAKGERLGELGLRPIIAQGKIHNDIDRTESIDAVDKVSSGISARNRANTILSFVNPRKGPSDFLSPGHIFPLLAKEGGVLVRAGYAEAAVDLARLAGLYPAGVTCEIIKDDGTIALVPDLMEFAQKYKLRITTIADLILHRMKTEKLVRRGAIISWGR